MHLDFKTNAADMGFNADCMEQQSGLRPGNIIRRILHSLARLGFMREP